VLTGDGDVVVGEQVTDGRRRRRDESRGGPRESPEVRGVETVDVFRRVDPAADGARVDAVRERRLDEDGVDVGVLAQRIDRLEDCRLGCAGAEPTVASRDSQFGTRPVFEVHEPRSAGRVTRENCTERRDSVAVAQRPDPVGHVVADGLGHRFAAQFRRHGRPFGPRPVDTAGWTITESYCYCRTQARPPFGLAV
jgi:hypothetical protein